MIHDAETQSLVTRSRALIEEADRVAEDLRTHTNELAEMVEQMAETLDDNGRSQVGDGER